DDNRDDIPDLVIGKPFEHLSGFSDNGQVAILYSGPDSLAVSRLHLDAGDFPGPGMGTQQFFGVRLAARPSASGQAPQLAIGALGTWMGLPGAGAVYRRTVTGGGGQPVNHVHSELHADNFGAAQAFDQLGHGMAYALRPSGSGYHHDYLLLGLPGEGGDIGAVGVTPSNFFTVGDYPVFDQADLVTGNSNEPDDRFGATIATGNFNGR